MSPTPLTPSVGSSRQSILLEVLCSLTTQEGPGPQAPRGRSQGGHLRPLVHSSRLPTFVLGSGETVFRMWGVNTPPDQDQNFN